MGSAHEFAPGTVSILVPAKDEADAIGATLRSLPMHTLELAGFLPEVVVLDGHSRDATRDIAYHDPSGPTVIFETDRGKGNAFRHALPLVRGEYIVVLDADGTYAPDALPRLLEPLAWNEADVVMGTRILQRGSQNGTHRIGNVLLSAAARVLYETACPDLCTGLWGFRAEALHRLPLEAHGFELEAELFAVAARLRLRIRQVPVDYLPRIGATKLSTSDGLAIAWCLLHRRVAAMPPRAAATPGPPGSTGRRSRHPV